jgi:succinate-semialdehyde dehydrogenase/glutarate-semialdehyde dehydrogenase
LKLAEIFANARIPVNVVNVVTGSDLCIIGDVLLRDPRVRKMTFTGSMEVGKEIMRKAVTPLRKSAWRWAGTPPARV